MRLSHKTLVEAFKYKGRTSELPETVLQGGEAVQARGSLIYMVYLRSGSGLDGVQDPPSSSSGLQCRGHIVANRKPSCSSSTPTRTFIGIITVWQPIIPSPQLGWYILEAWQGTAFAPEAARAVFHYLRDDFGMQDLWCATFEGNTQSVRVAEKFGFRRMSRTVALAMIEPGDMADMRACVFVSPGMNEFAEETVLVVRGGRPEDVGVE